MSIETIFPCNSSNINLLWASLFIEELIRHDIDNFCIAPGSRSTPLTLAIANHQQAKRYIHFDERGLGFFALGLVQATQKPVVIVTTSGTAVANLYPAVIEARQSGLPLIVISADRPAQLLDCGANQAIEQHAIFANYPVFFAQIIQPSTDVKANYLLTTIDHGLNKQRNQPGPIHFNIAFTEPLYPTNQTINYQEYLSSLKNWSFNNCPFTQFVNKQTSTFSEDTSLSAKKVLIIVAKMRNKQEAQLVTQFCKDKNLTLLTDIQSSQSGEKHNLSHYDLLLNNAGFTNLLQQADLVVQFGEQLLSKALSIFMANFEGEQQLISMTEKRIDSNHQLDSCFNGTATQWIEAQNITYSESNNHWYKALRDYHDLLKEQIVDPFLLAQPFSEITVIKQLDSILPKGTPLFISNSTPIRFADMLMTDNKSTIFSNRGASGIDGLLATSIGVAKGCNQTTTLLIGDTSFLYDLNSLTLLKQLATSFIIIVINNDGGAIFNQLPVPKQHRKNFYQLPHGLNFKASCEQFGIDYHNPHQLIDFKDTYNKCLQMKHSLIEITVPNQQSATQLQQLKEQIQNATL